MKRSLFSVIAVAALACTAGPAAAVERCFTSIDGLQVVVDGQGALRLYVYSLEFGGNNYMTYAGSVDALKSFHAQLLYARATDQKVCVSYTPGTPSYAWNLTAVAVARESGWPFE